MTQSKFKLYICLKLIKVDKRLVCGAETNLLSTLGTYQQKTERVDSGATC